MKRVSRILRIILRWAAIIQAHLDAKAKPKPGTKSAPPKASKKKKAVRKRKKASDK